MKITIEAETDEERESFGEPRTFPSVRLFALAGWGAPGPFNHMHGEWRDIKPELVRFKEYHKPRGNTKHKS